jgi:hypothetical protein
MEARSGSRSLKWLFWLVAVPIVLFVAYCWVMLTWSYSTGERAGYVQKLSKRGWLCKTWEGELALITMPGTIAEKFPFTVRDSAIADQINASMGKRVAVDYEQHVGLPSSCFGDTSHFATGVRVVDEPTLSPAPNLGNPAAATPADALAAPSVVNPAFKGADMPGIKLDENAAPPAAGSVDLPDEPAAPATKKP